jgi:hypothetical protein
MDEQRVEVARVQGPVETEVVRQLLGSYGIDSYLTSRVQHSILPFTVDGLGEVRILVAAKDAGRARQLLAEHRQGGIDVVSDEPSGDGNGTSPQPRRG